LLGLKACQSSSWCSLPDPSQSSAAFNIPSNCTSGITTGSFSINDFPVQYVSVISLRSITNITDEALMSLALSEELTPTSEWAGFHSA